MKKLYVVGNQPVRIPGYGSKAPGAYFELESDALAEAYAAENPALSLLDPSAKAPIKREVKPAEAMEDKSS